MLDTLYKIETLLIEAGELFEGLDDSEQIRLNQFHNECYSLAHCLRWGQAAATEVLADTETAVRQGLTAKVGLNQIYFDKLDDLFVVEKFEFYDGYKDTGKPMYSVLDGFATLKEAYEAALNPREYERSRLNAKGNS